MYIADKKLFNRLFPPPQFLKMPAVGLDISDESIHFVELKREKNGLVIKNYGKKDLPVDIVKSGYIKKEEELKKILSSLKKEFSSDFISVSLPEQHAYLLKLKLPKMKRNEIRGSIELQLEDNIPISPAEAVFDYEIINDKTYGKDTEVEIAAFPRTIIENYLSVFHDVALSPLAFEIEAHAISRSVIDVEDNGTTMIIDFGKTKTGLSIVSGGLTRFASTVEIGGSAITRAIENSLKVKREEAEKIKKEKGVFNRKENEELFLTIMSMVAVLKEEIRKHYVYWHTHKDQYGKKRPKIEKIVLCGGDSNLKGLSGYLATNLKVDVTLANVMVNINSFDKYIPEINFKDSLQYAAAIGLALRYSA